MLDNCPLLLLSSMVKGSTRGNKLCRRLSMVPSLLGLCLRRLSVYPDHAHLLPAQLRLKHGLVQELLEDGIDDALWATLVQVFVTLPPALSSHSVGLDNPHIAMFQRLATTASFSLLTVLQLPGCADVADSSIVRLTKPLRTLAYLDVSRTSLSAYGIELMANCQQHDENNMHSGPLALRVLYMRGCEAVTDDIYSQLARFPLLSVVGMCYCWLSMTGSSIIDLCDTQCHASKVPAHFSTAGESDLDYFSPQSPCDVLDALRNAQLNLSPSSKFYTLIVNKVSKLKAPPKRTVAPQNSFFVLPSIGPIISGHLDAPERKQQDMALETTIHRPRVRKRSLPNSTDSSLATSPSSGPTVTDPPLRSSSDYTTRSSGSDPSTFYASLSRTDSNTTRRRPTISRAALMLVRTPPPWTALEDALAMLRARTDSARRASGAHHTDEAVLGSASSSTKRRLAEMMSHEMEARKQRKTVSSKEPEQIVGESRNPFRPRTSKTSSTSTAKPLIPISRVKVPTLPPEFQRSTDKPAKPVRPKDSQKPFDWRTWGKSV